MASDRQSLMLQDTKPLSTKPEKRRNRLSVEIPAPGQSRISLCSPVKRDVKTINRRSTWFGKAFDAVGNDGVIDKRLFVKATYDIEVKGGYMIMHVRSAERNACNDLLR